MKYSYIVIGVFIIILGLVGYFVFLRPNALNPEQHGQPTGNTQQPNKIIPVDPVSIPAGDKISFGTAHGTVEVNNFYKVAKGYNGDALVIQKTPEYEIIYNSANSAFGIYITGGQVGSSRTLAEADLVNTLGIPQAQVCYLNVVWSVSASLDKSMSGRNYPLSFCSKTR